MDLLVRAAEERQEIVAKYEQVRNWLVGWKQKCLIMRKVNGHKYLCLCYKIHTVYYIIVIILLCIIICILHTNYYIHNLYIIIIMFVILFV